MHRSYEDDVLDVDAARFAVGREEPEDDDPWAGSNVDLPTPEYVAGHLLRVARAQDAALAEYREAVDELIPAADAAWLGRARAQLDGPLRGASEVNLRLRLDAGAAAEVKARREAYGQRDAAREELETLRSQAMSLAAILRVAEAPREMGRTAGRVAR